MKRVVVLMAGGRSERLWPYSRTVLPKQFLPLTGDGQTMIQKTVRRLLPMVMYEDIFVVTNEAYVPLVKQQLPDLPVKNILAEPSPKNTAPCIAFATAIVKEKYGDAVMMVLASDHLIRNEDKFLNTMMTAADFAEKHESLVTIGILPAYPEVGYGYIHYDRKADPLDDLFPVHCFVEKPDMEHAQLYCASGEYLWNSGMFVWRLSVITNHFESLMPNVYQGMLNILEAIRTNSLSQQLPAIFDEMPSTSIDYGIMEHAPSIYTIPGTFEWLDVGNWNALPLIDPADEDGNLYAGDVVSLDSKDMIVKSTGDRLVALIGVDNLAVIDTSDALLVCRRDRLPDIKKILAQLRAQERWDKL